MSGACQATADASAVASAHAMACSLLLKGRIRLIGRESEVRDVLSDVMLIKKVIEERFICVVVCTFLAPFVRYNYRSSNLILTLFAR